jgi:hypothetical protein
MLKKITIVLTLIIFCVTTQVKAYDKKETVKVKTDEYGNVESISVEDLIEIDDENEELNDYSLLSDIENEKGDEQYTIDNNQIVWQNLGENIYYKGNTNKQLPISIKTTYYLDNQETKIENLNQKSGKVKIRYDYQNNETQTVDNYSLHVPFVCMTVLMVSNEDFHNITITSGKIIDMEDYKVIVMISMPNIKEDLNLNNLDQTKDIDIYDYAEVEMDTDNFDLQLNTTIVSTIGLNEIDGLDDVEDLIEGIEELTDASSTLLDSNQQLYKGLKQVNQYLNEYFTNVTSLDKGLDTLEKSLKQLSTQKDTLSKSLTNTSSNQSTSELTTMIQSLNTEIQTMNTFIKEVKAYKESINDIKTKINNIDLSSLNSDATLQAQEKMKNIIEKSSLDDESKEELMSQVKELQITDLDNQYTKELNSISSELANLKQSIPSIDTDSLLKQNQAYSKILKQYTNSQDTSSINNTLTSINQLLQSVDKIYDGVKKLHQGSSMLTTYQKSLQESMNKIVSSDEKLTNAYKTFNTGLQKLNNKDLKEIINRFKALQKIEKQYDNYSGKVDGTNSEVVFIYESK